MYYKYRSLENFEFFVDILVNQQLYATSYKDMNDAMEGIYYESGIPPSALLEIKEEKERFNICSLSRDCNNPLLWAHYANGSRGVNIGIEVEESEILDFKDIIYGDLPTIRDCSNTLLTAKKILTHKHKSWEYEEETRIFTSYNEKYVKIEIKKIILGERISDQHKQLIKSLAEKLVPNAQLIENQRYIG